MNIARTRAALAVGVIAVGLTVAACGSSSSSGSGTTAAAAGAPAPAGSTSARGSALRACLEKHGVTLPNRRPGSGGGPPPTGGFFGGGGGGGGAGGGGGGGGAAGGPGRQFNDPKFRAALQACGGLRGGFRGGRRFQLSHTAINSFVSCVRKNGYSQMPNPNFSGGAIFPTSIRTNKQFQAAARKCENLLRPPRPAGGTSTNPGA
jgi:hypothetical protein